MVNPFRRFSSTLQTELSVDDELATRHGLGGFLYNLCDSMNDYDSTLRGVTGGSKDGPAMRIWTRALDYDPIRYHIPFFVARYVDVQDHESVMFFFMLMQPPSLIPPAVLSLSGEPGLSPTQEELLNGTLVDQLFQATKEGPSFRSQITTFGAMSDGQEKSSYIMIKATHLRIATPTMLTLSYAYRVLLAATKPGYCEQRDFS